MSDQLEDLFMLDAPESEVSIAKARVLRSLSALVSVVYLTLMFCAPAIVWAVWRAVF